MSDVVYLNGRFLPQAEAVIPVMDRGFLFGDGVYEVIPVYGGRLFRCDHHLMRLDQSLAGIRIDNPLDRAAWRALLGELIERNGGGDQSLYLQVTRGVAARRDHAFPAGVTPTVFVMSQPLTEPSPALLAGVCAITVPDIRWALCNIKAIALLPNVLARQQALDAGATEAVLVRDGQVTEGSASNLFVVHEGVVRTPPLSHLLLPGITRDLTVELCRANAIPCEEAPVAAALLRQADEIWLTSSTKEVVPVTRLDGVPVGSGQPGAVWRRVSALYRDYKRRFRAGEVE